MKLLVATTALFAAGFSIAASNTGTGHADSPPQPHPIVVASVDPTAGCKKTFTIPMAERAARAVYAGAQDVSKKERQMLRRIKKCQRNQNAIHYVAWLYHRAWKQWKQRRYDAAHPYSTAVASYYDTHGIGACDNSGGDVQAGYRFASLILPCGAVVEFCHGSRCVQGVMGDHGPYVGGRTFDFNTNMHDALGCGGICYITWRRL
jgi:hypothetical protein